MGSAQTPWCETCKAGSIKWFLPRNWVVTSAVVLIWSLTSASAENELCSTHQIYPGRGNSNLTHWTTPTTQASEHCMSLTQLWKGHVLQICFHSFHCSFHRFVAEKLYLCNYQEHRPAWGRGTCFYMVFSSPFHATPKILHLSPSSAGHTWT